MTDTLHSLLMEFEPKYIANLDGMNKCLEDGEINALKASMFDELLVNLEMMLSWQDNNMSLGYCTSIENIPTWYFNSKHAVAKATRIKKVLANEV